MSSNNNSNYNKKLQPNANKLRKEMTKSEACLWKFVLSKRQMRNYQFRRQRPIDNYIVDFVCLPLKLIIEVDGSTHDNEVQYAKDKIRDETLKSLGFTILRINDSDVLTKISSVTNLIGCWIDEHAVVPPPSPRQRGKS